MHQESSELSSFRWIRTVLVFLVPCAVDDGSAPVELDLEVSDCLVERRRVGLDEFVPAPEAHGPDKCHIVAHMVANELGRVTTLQVHLDHLALKVNYLFSIRVPRVILSDQE